MGDTKRDGIWLVAEFDGNRAVVGRVSGKGNELTPEVKNKIFGDKRTELSQCYDFFAPLRPIQQKMPDGSVAVGITRDPVVTGNHFTFSPVPVYISLALASKVFFFDEMKPGDLRRYEDFLTFADDSLEKQRLADSGLVSGRQEAGPPLRLPLDLSKLSAP